MKNLTEGNIYKNFFVFSVPLVLAGLLSAAYATVDNVIAGKFLGQNGLAATGATSQAIRLFACLFYGFSVGFGMYIAKLFGGKNYNSLKSAVFSVTFLILSLIMITSAVLIVLHNPLLKLLNVNEKIYNDAAIYFCIYIGVFFIIFLNHFFMCIFNAIGLSIYPFFMSVISGILNIAGNIISVTVLGLGVKGIAFATVFAAFVVDMVYIIKFYFCLKEMGVEKARLSFDKQAVKEFMFYGLPTSFQQMAMYISSALISPVVNSVGVAATAGYSVAMHVYDIVAGIYQNASRTLANYTAQCFGGKQYGKIPKGVFVGFLQELIFTVPVITLCAVFATPLTMMFFPRGFEGAAVNYAVIFVRFFLPFVVFNIVCNLFHGFFRGIGVMHMVIVSTALASAVRILASAVLFGFFSVNGVYAGWLISWIFEAAFSTLFFLKYYNTEEKLKNKLEKNFEKNKKMY